MNASNLSGFYARSPHAGLAQKEMFLSYCMLLALISGLKAPVLSPLLINSHNVGHRASPKTVEPAYNVRTRKGCAGGDYEAKRPRH